VGTCAHAVAVTVVSPVLVGFGGVETGDDDDAAGRRLGILDCDARVRAMTKWRCGSSKRYAMSGICENRQVDARMRGRYQPAPM